MKATDLMIGDYIQDLAGDLCQVIVLDRQVAQVETLTGVHQGDTTRYLYEAEGVPLTPEILEKNGFHAYSDVSQEWFIGVFKDGNKYLELTYSKGDIDWTINGDEYCIAPIKYVHTLQHVIKLYGIEKEIVL